MLNYNTDTAVLFLVFNRPDTTQQIFDKIKLVKPERLYVAADGPRTPEEEIICNQVRAIIQEIDWDCELKTLFREENLGCKKAVSEAISWFFNNEEEGIILEDDYLPSESFFGFCSTLLEKYRDNKLIAHIGGTNFQDGISRGAGSYYFSKLTHVWGWAGWRRVWKNYDASIESFKSLNDGMLTEIPSIAPFFATWIEKFIMVYNNEIDTWDYQYAYLNLMSGSFSIIPNQNLIKNIGIGPNTTHTKEEHPLGISELTD